MVVLTDSFFIIQKCVIYFFPLASKDNQGLSLIKKVFIGVEIVILLAIVAGFSVVYNNENSMFSDE